MASTTEVLAPGTLSVSVNTSITDSLSPTAQDKQRSSAPVKVIQGAGTVPIFQGGRSNGTIAVPTDIAVNEEMFRTEAAGRATSWFTTAFVKYIVDAAVVGAQRPASRIEYGTNLNNAVAATRMTLYSDGQLAIGAYTSATKPDTFGEPNSLLSVISETADQGVFTAIYTNSTAGGQYRLGSARGTIAAPLIVQNGDTLGEIEFYAYTGAAGLWQHAGAEIVSFVDGAVVANQIPPSCMTFFTSPVNTAPIAQVTIYSNGVSVFGADAQSAGLAFANAALVQVAGNSGNSTLFSLHYSADDATSPTALFRKSRNTLAAPTAGINNDNMGRFSFQCYNGLAYNSQARINCYMDGVPVANQGQMTRIEFETTAANNGSPTTRVCVNRLGVLALTTSGTAPVVSGNNYGAIQIMSTAPVSGIYLGNAANTATNVLDWYEEGTWTPDVGLGDTVDTTGITYTTRNGTFTRIGNRVWAAFNFDINAWPGAGGTIGIKSLPYALNSAALQANGGSVFDYFNTIGLTSCPWLAYDTAIGTSGFRFQEFSATGLVDLVRGRFQTGTGCHGLLMYQCAT